MPLGTPSCYLVASSPAYVLLILMPLLSMPHMCGHKLGVPLSLLYLS